MGNYKSARQHIETAKKSGTLQFGNLGLKDFPDEMKQLSGNLRVLDMSQNQLQQVAQVIGLYTQLRILILSQNKLTHIADEIGKLIKLENLSLEKNLLTHLPNTVAQLKNLRRVNLSENKLEHFPEQFCSSKHLDVLDLSHNKIATVPPNVRHLTALELILNRNQISSLSEGVAECPRLKVLRLQENCLEISCLTPRIMKESQIALIEIEGNLFDMKAFHNLDGYDQYMERFTATKKKMT